MRIFVVVVLMLAAIALGIAGIVFMAESTNSHVQGAVGDRYMVVGIVCLSLGTVLLIVGSVLGFIIGRKRECPED